MDLQVDGIWIEPILIQRSNGREAVSNDYLTRRIAATGDASRRQTALALAQTLVQVPAQETRSAERTLVV